jgi:hypothetical protein
MNKYAQALIDRLAKGKSEKIFIDGCCSIPGCYDRPVVILFDDEHDDFQVCESCYRKYQAAQQTLAPDAVPAENAVQ